MIAKAIDRGLLPPDIADYALRAGKQPATLAGGNERADPAVVAGFEGKGLFGPKAEELGQISARREAERAQIAVAGQQLVDQLAELKSAGSSISKGSVFPLGGQAPTKTLVEQTKSKAEKLEELRREAYELERELGKTREDRRSIAGGGETRQDRRSAAPGGVRRESRRSLANPQNKGVRFGGQDDDDPVALSRRQSEIQPDDDADVFRKPPGPKRQSMPAMPAPPSDDSRRQSGVRPPFKGRQTYAPDPAAARDSFIPQTGPPQPQIRTSFATKAALYKDGQRGKSVFESWGRAQAGPVADAPEASAAADDAVGSGSGPPGSEPAGSSADPPPQPSERPLPEDPQSEPKASGRPSVAGDAQSEPKAFGRPSAAGEDGKRSDSASEAPAAVGPVPAAGKRKSKAAETWFSSSPGGGLADPVEEGGT